MKKGFWYSFLLLLVFCLGACGDKEQEGQETPNEDRTFTVVFYDANMDVLHQEEVGLGQDASLPNPPEKEGYLFDGWSVETDNVLSDLEVYPIFIPIHYSICYYSDGVLVYEEEGLNYLEDLPGLYLMDKEGYQFMGWYVDADYETLFAGTKMPSNDLHLHAKWVIESSLATEEVYYFRSTFGNTNGNLQNLGLAVYDFNRSRHLYSVGQSIYTYNPSTDTSELILTSAYGGRPMYLNIYADQLYYIDSAHGYLMSYDLVDQELTLISEKEYHYLGRYQSYIYAMSYEDYYGEDRFVLRYYSESSASFGSMTMHTVEHINMDRSRLLFTEMDAQVLRLSATNFYGQTNVVDFVSLGFDEIKELIVEEVNQDYDVFLGMLASKGEELGFYLYDTVDGLRQVQVSNNLHALNFNGEFYYYIDGQSMVKVNPETLAQETILALGDTIDFLCMVQHWIYYGDAESDLLYRVHPDTLEIEVLSD